MIVKKDNKNEKKLIGKFLKFEGFDVAYKKQALVTVEALASIINLSTINIEDLKFILEKFKHLIHYLIYAKLTYIEKHNPTVVGHLMYPKLEDLDKISIKILDRCLNKFEDRTSVIYDTNQKTAYIVD